jgi:tetratricopeptide (TPR) repeat protein
MAGRLSLCMVVKNEELLLGQALDGVRDVVDECVVVDTGSSDRTVEIARSRGARIVHYRWDGSLGRARNVYLAHATGDWVLVLDGDERIARKDVVKIRPLIARRDAVAYRFTVHDYTQSLDLLGDWHRNTGRYPEEEAFSRCRGHSRFSVIRLFRRTPGVEYEEGFSTHTNPLDSLRRLSGKILDARVVLHHFQVLKGGAAFVVGKLAARLPSELRHLAAHPRHFLGHLNVGRAMFTLGRDREAMDHLNRAVALDRASEQAYFARGVLRCQLSQFRRAARDLEAAVRLRPDFAGAWIALGIAYHGQARIRAAKRALLTALRLRPSHPVALNSLGVLRLEQGRLSEAALHFRRSLRVLPDHAIAARNLVELYEAQGALGAAARVCRRANQECPADPWLSAKHVAMQSARHRAVARHGKPARARVVSALG